MQSNSQAYSQSTTPSCGESGGEMMPNAAVNQTTLPGFSAEQISSILKLFQAVSNQRVGPLQQPIQQPSPAVNSFSPYYSSSYAVRFAGQEEAKTRKTRNQYKKKAQAQLVTIQEVKHSYGQEMDSVRISLEKVASKHVVLQLWDWMATSLHAAVISCVGMPSFDGMITIGCGIMWRLRMGVGWWIYNAAGSMWESQQDEAKHLCIFSLRSPGDRVGSTPIVGCISRSPLSTRLRYCMQACIHFDGSTVGLLTTASNGEASGDAGLFVSRILQYLLPCGYGRGVMMNT